MKTIIKKINVYSYDELSEDAKEKLIIAQSILDKLVVKGVIKKNKASNQKAKLTKHANKLS